MAQIGLKEVISQVNPFSIDAEFWGRIVSDMESASLVKKGYSVIYESLHEHSKWVTHTGVVSAVTDNVVTILRPYSKEEEMAISRERETFLLELQHIDTEINSLTRLLEREQLIQRLETAQSYVARLSDEHIYEIAGYPSPPLSVRIILVSVIRVLCIPLTNKSWRAIQAILRQGDIISRIKSFNADSMSSAERREIIFRFPSIRDFDERAALKASHAVGILLQWVKIQIELLQHIEFKPLQCVNTNRDLPCETTFSAIRTAVEVVYNKRISELKTKLNRLPQTTSIKEDIVLRSSILNAWPSYNICNEDITHLAKKIRKPELIQCLHRRFFVDIEGRADSDKSFKESILRRNQGLRLTAGKVLKIDQPKEIDRMVSVDLGGESSFLIHECDKQYCEQLQFIHQRIFDPCQFKIDCSAKLIDAMHVTAPTPNCNTNENFQTKDIAAVDSLQSNLSHIEYLNMEGDALICLQQGISLDPAWKILTNGSSEKLQAKLMYKAVQSGEVPAQNDLNAKFFPVSLPIDIGMPHTEVPGHTPQDPLDAQAFRTLHQPYDRRDMLERKLREITLHPEEVEIEAKGEGIVPDSNKIELSELKEPIMSGEYNCKFNTLERINYEFSAQDQQVLKETREEIPQFKPTNAMSSFSFFDESSFPTPYPYTMCEVCARLKEKVMWYKSYCQRIEKCLSEELKLRTSVENVLKNIIIL